MAEVLGRPLSDGSYWTINLNLTATSPPMNCPPEGLLTMDLRFNRSVVFRDRHGNPSQSEEFGLFRTVVPTLHLPGTMNRAEYYTALHQWLHSSRSNQLPLDGDVVNDFTDYVIESVFGRVNSLEKVAICIQAELHRVSLEYESMGMTIPMESEYDDETEYYEEEEDEEGLMEYVQKMSDDHRVIAAEEHRRFGDCSICLEGLVRPVGEEQKLMKNYLFGSRCGHYFHSECMEKWLMMSDSCPLCRFDMSVAHS